MFKGIRENVFCIALSCQSSIGANGASRGLSSLLNADAGSFRSIKPLSLLSVWKDSVAALRYATPSVFCHWCLCLVGLVCYFVMSVLSGQLIANVCSLGAEVLGFVGPEDRLLSRELKPIIEVNNLVSVPSSSVSSVLGSVHLSPLSFIIYTRLVC